MRPLLVVTAALTLGCGPQVSLGFEDDTGDSTGADGTHATSGGMVPNPADDDDELDTGEFDLSLPPSDDGPPPPLEDCWNTQELFEVPADVNILVADQDGDGADELWLQYTIDTGPGPGETTLFRVDETGVPGPEIPLPGFLVSMGDVDGDGWLDLVLIDFSGGFPPVFSYARGDGPGSFAFPALPMELELEQGLSGFFDVDGDARIDLFRQLDDGTIQLEIGDGAGSFLPASAIPIADDGNVFTSPVPGAPGQALVQSANGFGGGGGPPPPVCPTVDYELLDGSGGQLTALAASPPAVGDMTLGPAHRAHGYASGTTVVYTSACEFGQPLAQLRQLVATPDQLQMTESVIIDDMQWATVGDFDADGWLDLAFAANGARTFAWSPGMDEVSFAPPQPTDIPVAEVRGNNVRAVDLDGDGREEILRGWLLAEGEPAQLFYDRLWYGPCEQ